VHHLNGIEDLLTLCAFWEKYERPEAAQVVSGELETWNETSGQIAIAYSLPPPARKARAKPRTARAALDGLPQTHDRSDWLADQSMWMHPLAFAGNYSIELDGVRFPNALPDLRFVVAAEWDRAYLCGFVRQGSALGNNWIGYVVSADASGAEAFAKGEIKASDGAAIDVRVSVSGSSVALACDGRRICAIEKPNDLWGGVALISAPQNCGIRIEGKAHAAWIQNRADAFVQANLAQFSRTFDPRAAMPEALRARAERPPSAASAEDALPGTPTAADTAGAAKIGALEKAGELEDALAIAMNESPTALSQDVSDWLTARLLSRTRRSDEAIERLDRLADAQPGFVPALVLRAELWAASGRRSDALAEADALVAAHPQDPRAVVLRARALALLDRADEAEAALRAARDAGFPPADFEAFQRTLDRVRNGPLWTKSYEAKTEHYSVRSDISQALCFRAAQLLERFYAKYNAHLKRVTGARKRFRVQLFSGQAGYHEFCEDLLGGRPEHTAGVYIPLLKQLVIWNLPEADQMLHTVVHEGFHQYLDQVAPTAPVWFNEGMAEYFESSKLVDGQWKDGVVNGQHVALLASARPIPLREFTRIARADFYGEDVMRNYAQAWAFVHFLQHSGKGRTELLARFLKELSSGKLAGPAIELVFSPAIVDAMENEFAAYVRGLK
jgi:tetratricopeptide (TPR) repeat protein